MGQPNLAYFDPAYADELALMMAWAFDHMQRPDGSSVYLRLSTRAIPQIAREDDSWKNDILKGGYWLKQPGENAEAAIVFSRSDDRRVGKEGVSTCRSRWAPYHSKKKTKKKK